MTTSPQAAASGTVITRRPAFFAFWIDWLVE